MNSFTDTVAIVTGAGSGIGQATAERLAEEGAAVVVADVAVDTGQAVADAIDASGGTATFVEADVSDPEAVERMVETALSEYGGLDIAVNNAGILTPMAVTDEVDPEDWQRMLDINLTGVFTCMQHELPAMEEGGGAIVNVASVAGLVGMPTLSSYSASKHGVVGLTKSAALEYAARGIRINAVAPGPTETNISAGSEQGRAAMVMQFLPDEATQGKGVSGRVLNWLSGGTIDRMGRTPMDRLAQPEEIANVIAFLASEEASFVTGQVVPVDGGQSVD